ncbi:hypothetical protein [Aerosakkonema funiforme]|uniref:hypothetical protein n=1 Tax=Aerosakkonema funiforme TaxID=1246630 RepID=UPI0035BADA45
MQFFWERLCAPIDSDGGWNLLARDQRVPFSLYIPTIIVAVFLSLPENGNDNTGSKSRRRK